MKIVREDIWRIMTRVKALKTTKMKSLLAVLCGKCDYGTKTDHVAKYRI